MKLEEIYKRFNIEKIAQEISKKHIEIYGEEDRYSESSELEKLKRHINYVLSGNPHTPSEILREIMEVDSNSKIAYDIASNPNTPTDILYQLFEQGYFSYLADNPKCPSDIIQQIYDNTISNSDKKRKPDISILYRIAQNPNTPQEILTVLSESKEEYYATELSPDKPLVIAIAKNPNVPLSVLEKLSRTKIESNRYKEKDLIDGIRRAILMNPNAPESLINEIIDIEGKGINDRRFPNLSQEQIMKLNRIDAIMKLGNILLQNPNLSPDIIQIIEQNLSEGEYRSYYDTNLNGILYNPNTPSSIIEKHIEEFKNSNWRSLKDFDSVVTGRIPHSTYFPKRPLEALLRNPNLSGDFLTEIRLKLDETDAHPNVRGVVGNLLLEHPNLSKEDWMKYIKELEDIDDVLDKREKIDRILERGTSLFEILEQEKGKHTSLREKEEELSALEKEAQTISEAEALIDQQKEGQNIGEG